MMIKIKNILTELNTNIPDLDVQRNIDWKLKSLSLTTCLVMENNVVDFTKLNGIIGMFTQTLLVNLSIRFSMFLFI